MARHDDGIKLPDGEKLPAGVVLPSGEQGPNGQMLPSVSSPLIDIQDEILKFRATGPTHGEMRAFLLRCVEAHPKQAADILMDYFLPSSSGT